jgi:hypothetical protein
MNDDDIRAFGPAEPGPAGRWGAAHHPPSRRRWPWVLGAAALLGLVVLTATVAAAMHGLHLSLHDGAWEALELGSASFDSWTGLGSWLGVLMVLLFAVLLVPLALALALGGVALGIAAVLLVVLGLLALVVLVVAVALSPLWLLGLLLWLALRPRRLAPAGPGRGSMPPGVSS